MADCACNPANKVTCINHAELDGYVITQSLSGKPKLVEIPLAKVTCEFKKCPSVAKWVLRNKTDADEFLSCGSHITSMIRKVRVADDTSVTVREIIK